MKEMYKSPELEVLCLASAERLANNESIDFDQLNGGTGGNGGSSTVGDVIIDIPLN